MSSERDIAAVTEILIASEDSVRRRGPYGPTIQVGPAAPRPWEKASIWGISEAIVRALDRLRPICKHEPVVHGATGFARPIRFEFQSRDGATSITARLCRRCSVLYAERQ
jgi:hypothetical protein